MPSLTPDWTAVVERLEKLERQHRRMKRAGAVALIIAAAVLLMGQATPDRVIEANEFVLKDMSGRRRAVLNSAGLNFLDANGKARAGLNVVGEMAILNLWDANEVMRAGLSVHEDTAALTFYAANGEVQAGLVVGEGDAQLTLSDNEGFQTTIGTSELGTPLTGETQKTSAASVLLLDKDKKPRAVLTLTEHGTGLALQAVNGEARAFLVVDEGVPSLTMLDADKKVLWKAP